MARETGFGTFEMESATLGQFMTLVAFHSGYRRMLMERRKAGGRPGSAIEPDFLRARCRDERDFVLAGQTLRITLPASPDAFLDDPEVLAANRQSDYMPYWSYLWPASLETAVAVLNHDWQLASPPLSKGGQGRSLPQEIEN